MPSINDRIHRIGTPEAKARDLVMSRLGASKRAYGGQTQILRELNRYYHSLSPAHPANRLRDQPVSSKRDRRVDLFVPISFSVVESAVPQWMFALFGTRPFVELEGRTPDDHERKDVPQVLLEYDFDQANIFIRSIPFAKNLFKYGTAVGKVTYRYDTFELARRKRRKKMVGLDEDGAARFDDSTEEVVRTIERFDGPWIDWVSIFNVHFDPLHYDIEDMRYVIEQKVMDRGWFDTQNERMRALTGKPLYTNLEKIPKLRKGSVERMYDADDDGTAEAMGWTGSWDISGPSYQGVRAAELDIDNVVQVTEYWGLNEQGEPRVIEIANGETVIRDDDNPYDDKRKPYVVSQCMPIEGYPYGIGLLHPIRQLQEELNSWRNMLMRQGALNVHNIWGYDEESGGLPPALLEPIEPGDILPIRYTSSGKPLLQPLMQGRPIPAEGYRVQDMIMSDVQRTIAFNDFVMGGVGSGGTDTATEARMLQAGAGSRSKLQAGISEVSYLLKVADFFVERRQQYLDERKMIRIAGSEGVTFREIDPEALIGDYDFRPTGTHFGPDRNVVRQQMEQAIALVRDNPQLQSYSNLYEMWLELWKRMEVPDPKRFVVKPPEKVFTPELENTILAAGEWVDVTAGEDHVKHLAAHAQLTGRPLDPRAQEQLDAHIRKHEAFTEQQGGQAGQAGARPQQEMAGLRGYQGNVPNLEQAVESEPSIAARVNGAGG